MAPKKLKAPEGLKPNCRVITDKRNPQWEPRWYDKETDYVYALHENYLWPQRMSGKYWRFEEIPEAAHKVFQDFLNYNEITKET